jgi:GNAT superfamily N-acetyltransferase
VLVARFRFGCTADIRPVSEHELPAVVAGLDQLRYFADRLARQRLGRGVLLVAWAEGTAVGDVYLRLEPLDAEELADLGDAPQVTHLEVLPPNRKQGIGSALMRGVETIAWRRGYRRIALGVAADNADAVRLYQGLGYQLWRSDPISTYREVFHDDGTVTAVPDEPCLVFVLDRPET